MAEFTAIGEVVANKAGALGVRVENEDERIEFWREHHVDFALGSFDPKFSAIAISRPQDVASCKAGDRASITVKIMDRSDGKRTFRTVAFQVLEAKP
jgi:hypothetical protein